MIEQMMKLAFAKAGISTTELEQLTHDAVLAAVIGVPLLFGPFVARVATMVGKLIVAIPAIMKSVARIYVKMQVATRESTRTWRAGRAAFCRRHRAHRMVFRPRWRSLAILMDFWRRRLPSTARCAVSATRLALPRHAVGGREAEGAPQQGNTRELAHRFQEQLIILQPIYDTMQEELEAMNGTLVLHDPNGVHPLVNNWGDFYTRMGIDPDARASGSPADQAEQLAAAAATHSAPGHDLVVLREQCRQ